MQQLQFVELDEGGRLVLTGDDGTQYAVRVDDRLRAALRPRPSVAAADDGSPAATVSPRDVQAMIRAGQPAEDVAASTGWDLERVRRFEGPVLAEREHVVGLAQRSPVRASGRTDGSHTLDRRVRERLQSRGVDLTAVSWDAARGEAHGPWTVIVAFGAGGRERRGAWRYDVRSRLLEALDDEARWLSEDEQALPGGLEGHPLLGASHGEDEAAADLMATMRERRQRRGRRSQVTRKTEDDPGHVPGQQAMPEEVLPLEDLPYDPETMGDPPAAHPRGSAPEAAAPVGPEDGEGAEETAADGAGADGTGAPEATEGEGSEPEPRPEPPSPEEAQRAVGRGKGRARKRRGLRLPAAASTEAVDDAQEPEGTFARTRHDPQEVTFDEFFGTGEDEDEGYHEPGFVDYVEPDDEDDVVGSESPAAGAVAPDEGDTPAEHVPDEAEASDADEQPDTSEQAAAHEESDVSAASGADEQPETSAPSDTDEQPDDSAQPDADEQPDDSAQSDADEPDEPQRPGRKGRTSVPSWDDIMFGSRDRH